MTSLSDLFDGDKAVRDPEVAYLRRGVAIPYTFHGTRYADCDAVAVSPLHCLYCKHWFEASRRLHCPVCRQELDPPRLGMNAYELPGEWSARSSDLT